MDASVGSVLSVWSSHWSKLLSGALRATTILFLTIVLTSCDEVRLPRDKSVDIPTTPLSIGGTWPKELPENSRLALSVEGSELVWDVEKIDRKDWRRSIALFSDAEEIRSDQSRDIFLHCETVLSSFKLIRRKSYDNCRRKMGEWFHGIGDFRLEQFTLRSESIDFVGRCVDWNLNDVFKPINYRCQAKGIVLGAGQNEGESYHIVLRFPLELLADIPLGPVE